MYNGVFFSKKFSESLRKYLAVAEEH